MTKGDNVKQAIPADRQVTIDLPVIFSSDFLKTALDLQSIKTGTLSGLNCFLNKKKEPASLFLLTGNKFHVIGLLKATGSQRLTVSRSDKEAERSSLYFSICSIPSSSLMITKFTLVCNSCTF